MVCYKNGDDNMKKKMLIIVLIICLIFGMTSTYSYYRQSITNNIIAQTKSYTFKISSDAIKTSEINLGDNLKPYDKGSFTINIDMENTEADSYFTIEVERISLPEGFKFLAQDDKLSPFGIYTKTFSSSDSTKKDSVTVYWYWDGDVNDEDDTSFINQKLSARVKIKSKQMNGAMMKNGSTYDSANKESSGTEFWNLNYRRYIRTINFVTNLSNKPNSCTGDSDLCWDISYSASQDKKVYAYLIDSGLKDDSSNTLYNLYIASTAEIYAPQDCSFIFSQFYNLESINFDNFITVYTTNMYGMFLSCKALKSIDLSSFNTANVTNMRSLFNKCESLTSIDLTNYNSSKASALTYMFYQCRNLKSLDLSSFNISNATDIEGLFYECENLEEVNLSSFNTSKVTNMARMFFKCYIIENIDIHNFDFTKATDLTSMFNECKKVKTINLGDFNIVNVTSMDYTFCTCRYLSLTLNIKNSTISNIKYMFLEAATDASAKIVLNYTEASSTLVDNMIATKGVNSNVVKGEIIA